MRRVICLAVFMLVWVLCFSFTCAAGPESKLSAVKERIQAKIEFVRKQTAYLDGEHCPREKKWQHYKNDADTLFKACEKTMRDIAAGDESSLEKLAEMEKQLGALSDKIPLKLPSGPKGRAGSGLTMPA